VPVWRKELDTIYEEVDEESTSDSSSDVQMHQRDGIPARKLQQLEELANATWYGAKHPASMQPKHSLGNRIRTGTAA